MVAAIAPEQQRPPAPAPVVFPGAEKIDAAWVLELRQRLHDASQQGTQSFEQVLSGETVCQILDGAGAITKREATLVEVSRRCAGRECHGCASLHWGCIAATIAIASPARCHAGCSAY